MPKITVIAVARKQTELDRLKALLARQSYKDFEFVGEVGGTIPQALNRAVARARGDILVFTETDAEPLSDNWLFELVSHANDKNTVIKGIEIIDTPWNLSNTACHRSLFENRQFDECFLYAEDTEFFSFLKSQGTHFARLQTAAVIHRTKGGTWTPVVERAFLYGVYKMKIKHRYKQPVDSSSIEQILSKVAVFFLYGIGLIVGYILFFPERFKRR